MRDKPYLNRNIGTILHIRQALVIRSLLKLYLVLIVATLFLLNSYSYCHCKCMSTTVRVNGTVQFTFFLVMRLNMSRVVIRLL